MQEKNWMGISISLLYINYKIGQIKHKLLKKKKIAK